MDVFYLPCAASSKTVEKLGAKLLEIRRMPKEFFGWHETMECQQIYRLGLASRSALQVTSQGISPLLFTILGSRISFMEDCMRIER